MLLLRGTSGLKKDNNVESNGRKIGYKRNFDEIYFK
jgi:hypothetical protein